MRKERERGEKERFKLKTATRIFIVARNCTACDFIMANCITIANLRLIISPPPSPLFFFWFCLPSRIAVAITARHSLLP